MCSDNSHSTFQRQYERTGVGVFAPDDGQGMFASGVGEQGQSSFGHAFPETREPPIAAVDILAVGQAFHHCSSAVKAPLQFFHRICARWMNRNRGSKLRMLLRQAKD